MRTPCSWWWLDPWPLPPLVFLMGASARFLRLGEAGRCEGEADRGKPAAEGGARPGEGGRTRGEGGRGGNGGGGLFHQRAIRSQTLHSKQELSDGLTPILSLSLSPRLSLASRLRPTKPKLTPLPKPKPKPKPKPEHTPKPLCL